MRICSVLCSVFALAALAPLSALAGEVVRWEASDGLLPDQSQPSWDLFDDADPEDPVLGPTFLTLSTDLEAENIFYSQHGAAIDMEDPVIVEARLRVLASTSSSAARAAMNVSVTLMPQYGNTLYIGIDEIFVLLDNNVKGPSAVVDTNGQFHTYRVEADFAGNFDVYYDNVLTLSGSSFTSASANGTVRRVLWGPGSSLSTGTAEFEYVEHNAGLPPVPALGSAGMALLATAIGAVAWCVRRR